MIVVDSSILIDVQRQNRTAKTVILAERVAAREHLAITDVTYMELLRGARTDAEIVRTKREVDHMSILRMRSLRDYESAARLFREARTRGRNIRRATDCMIAAVCIRENLPLLHDDSDFDTIADVSALQVV